jgi:hypothetical protein
MLPIVAASHRLPRPVTVTMPFQAMVPRAAIEGDTIEGDPCRVGTAGIIMCMFIDCRDGLGQSLQAKCKLFTSCAVVDFVW